MPIACRTERRLGTVRYISFFTMTNAIIGVLYVGITYAIAQTGLPIFVNAFVLSPCQGLWPIIIVELVIKFNKEPDQLVPFMCFPFNIKSKYYPWLLLLLFSLIGGIL